MSERGHCTCSLDLQKLTAFDGMPEGVSLGLSAGANVDGWAICGDSMPGADSTVDPLLSKTPDGFGGGEDVPED